MASKLKRASSDEAEPNGNTFKKVSFEEIPMKGRTAGSSRYNIAELDVKEGYEFDSAKDVRNTAVAARTYAKRQKAAGEVVPTYVTRKVGDKWFLIRES